MGGRSDLARKVSSNNGRKTTLSAAATATCNAAVVLPRWSWSLCAQEDLDIEWVVTSGDDYLAVGVTHDLPCDILTQYRVACASTESELVAARMEVDGRVYRVCKQWWKWLYRSFVRVSGCAFWLHSLLPPALLIKNRRQVVVGQ
jgi:hypothetical protein